MSGRARAAAWAAIAAAVLAVRLAHSGVIWTEEAYPAAAAVQLLHGKMLYRDFVFDKPPLAPLFYLSWGAWPGWAARVAGAGYVLLCAWLARLLAVRIWSDREGWIAAGLTAFALSFHVPAAVIALAPDALMIAPHLAAVLLAVSGRGFAAGALAGVALLVHTKGVFVLAACLLWGPRLGVLAGFASVTAASVAALAAAGALGGYWEQVWVWGSRYASEPLPGAAYWTGATRTASWLGFHAAALVGAVFVWRKQPRLAAWFGLCLAGALLGGRYFPRYYFLPLVPLVIAGSAGLAHGRVICALLALLVPFARFGPRHIDPAASPDLAMGRDAESASAFIRERAGPDDTILVWGYRPEILWSTRLPLGTPFLDSQPLTGVIADRHLTDSHASFHEDAARNQAALTGTSPTWVVDGLGPYNATLAITRFDRLRDWLARYEEAGRTQGTVIYRLKRNTVHFGAAAPLRSGLGCNVVARTPCPSRDREGAVSTK